MSNISKQELISNLKDKISQFKSNFSKNKEARKEVSELNFEINRDALKLFYKKKQEGGDEVGNPPLQKQQTNMEDIYDIKKILNENKTKSSSSKILIKMKNEEKKINNIELDNKNNDIGAKITFGGKDSKIQEISQSQKYNDFNILNKQKENNNEELLEKKNNNINDNINANININMNYRNDKQNEHLDNNKQHSKPNFEYENYSKYNQNNNIKDNISLGHITLNNSNYNDFNIDEMKNKKNEKRDKSAPKIGINQKQNNFYNEKPLTDKHNQNDININKNINYNPNYNTKNDFNTKKNNKTEELYQKLLVNFNINSYNKKNTSFYNFNTKNTINYNSNKENNPNKSYGQINIKDINLLYEINDNKNYNNYNQKKNYFRNELNLDHLKDLYNKKTDDYHKSNQVGLKTKMDMFYKELNDYKNLNNYKKQTIKNYYSNDNFINNNKFISNTQYNNYMKNRTNNNYLNKNLNYQLNTNNEKININKNDSDTLSYNDIHNFKQFLKDLSKEEMYNLPYNIKSELKEIFNILYQRFNE